MESISVATLAPLLAQAANNPPQGSSSNLIIWAVILLAIALALFLLELFIPSGGLLGLMSAAALIGGVVLMFRVDTTWGLISAVVALAALPFALGLAIKLWPHTPVARWLTLEEVQKPQTMPAAAAPHPLVGKRGRALTDLRPVGTVLLDGRRETCLARNGMIEAGTAVEVVTVDGMEIKVRPVA